MAQTGTLILNLKESPAKEALKWTFRDQKPKTVVYPVSFQKPWSEEPLVLLSVVGWFGISVSGEMPMTAFEIQPVAITTSGFEVLLVVSNGNQANYINVSWFAVSQAA